MICFVISMIILKCKSTFNQVVELVPFMLTKWVLVWIVLIAVLVLQQKCLLCHNYCVVCYFPIFLMNVWIWMFLSVFAYYAVSSLSLYDHLVLHTHHQVTPMPKGVWQINQEQQVTSSLLLVIVHYLILLISSFYLQTRFLLFIIFLCHK